MTQMLNTVHLSGLIIMETDMDVTGTPKIRGSAHTKMSITETTD